MITRVKNLRDAQWLTCECGLVIEPGIYWGLSTMRWLHTSGTGHTKFKRWAWLDA